MFSWGLGVGGGQPRGPPQPPSRCAGVYLYFASRGGRGGRRGSCPAPLPGVGGPLRKSARSPGHRGPWRTLCEPSPAARALDMPSLGCCLRTPEGWAVCGTPELGGGHGLPTHVRHPSRFPSKHLPRKLSPAGPSAPPQSTPTQSCGALRSAGHASFVRFIQTRAQGASLSAACPA